MKLFIFLVLVLLITLLITYISDVIKRYKEPIVLNFKTWTFPLSTYPNWYSVVKNGYNIKMSNTGITLPNNKFSISFMYKLKGLNSGHNNMFRITNTTGDCCNHGDRIRAVWVEPNATSFLLVVGTDANPNEYTTFPVIGLNTTVFITLLFDGNVFTIYINNVMTNTKTFVNVRPIPVDSTLYIGDQFYPANGEINIQDFTLYDGILTSAQIGTIYSELITRPVILKKWVFPLSTYPKWYTTVQNGYSIKMTNTGLTLPTNSFSMTFMYKLTGLNGTWNNIVHITNSGGDDHRCPGIWVRPNETNFHFHYVPSSIDSFEGVALNTQAFLTFIFNYNNVEFYINGVKRSIAFNNNGVLNTILPTATLYFGNPFHGTNGTINIQDFTIYDDVLTPDQITKIYNESSPEGRQKIINDQNQAAANKIIADRQAAAAAEIAYSNAVSAAMVTQKTTQANTALNDFKKQLAIDTSNNNYTNIANDNIRIKQYQDIIASIK